MRLKATSNRSRATNLASGRNKPRETTGSALGLSALKAFALMCSSAYRHVQLQIIEQRNKLFPLEHPVSRVVWGVGGRVSVKYSARLSVCACLRATYRRIDRELSPSDCRSN